MRGAHEQVRARKSATAPGASARAPSPSYSQARSCSLGDAAARRTAPSCYNRRLSSDLLSAEALAKVWKRAVRGGGAFDIVNSGDLYARRCARVLVLCSQTTFRARNPDRTPTESKIHANSG